MDNTSYHQRTKLRGVIKAVMVAIAAVLFLLSFNLMGGSRAL
ncbi:hypothetical protein [Lentilactobacillus rapi]|nr:hypothetical protein [Lentilactobacillus rapi]